MNTYNNIRNQKGFTLIEIMVALLITGIMMVLVMQFVLSQMNGYKREQMLSDTQQNLRAVMDEMERDIRMAGAGIPKVPIQTGYVSIPIVPGNVWPNYPIYPITILRGAMPPSTVHFGYSIFLNMWTISNAVVNDAIIIIYKDPERPLADTVLTADMINQTDPITIPATAINNNTGFSTTQPIPFIITDAAGTKADMFLATSVTINGTNAVLSTNVTWSNATNDAAYNSTWAGHTVNFNPASSSRGYRAGDKIFAVKVIRYDFSSDMDNFPITKLVNNDGLRGTDNEVGSFFGNIITIASPLNSMSVPNYTNQAMKIEYSPYLGPLAGASFSRGMPTDPYNIGTVRITLTARTSVKTATFGNNALLRTRTLTTDIQPRNYNGN